MERLQRPEGVNILKGQVRVECVEQSHMAAENTREHRRMLRMKFYVTVGIGTVVFLIFNDGEFDKFLLHAEHSVISL